MPELRLGLNDKVMFENTGRSASSSYSSWPLCLISITCSISASRGKAIEMEDVKFHQCVRLSRFENDRTISFIPPDGEFELMSYRLSTPVKPLIWVEATVESHRGSRVEYIVKCKAQFKRRSTANNVEIWVPVPDDADTPKFRVCDIHLELGIVLEMGALTILSMKFVRQRQGVCNMPQISLRSYGRSSNSVVVVSTS